MDYAEVNTIRGQFQAGHWPQFLEMVSISGLRGWVNQTVNFNFPVVAIVGENGTGKSTLLKCSACAYENRDKKKRFFPSSFFVDTHWDRIQDVVLTYRVKRGNDTTSYKITKPSRRWRVPESLPERNVFLFDVSRTLPLDASVGYAKIARSAAAEISTTDIVTDFRTRLSFVLGREYLNARFALSDADAKREVGLLEREWGEVSQFHQGAGEDSTLDLFRALQGIPDYSLLIVDEVEASLHPKAQRRLIRFFLWLCRRKRVQIVLSTHSPYVLEELPQEARILLLPGPNGLNIVYGVTPEFAMSRLDESVHPDVLVFVEDREARILLREILASSDQTSDLLGRIDVVPVGPANVVQIMGSLAENRRLPYKSIAVVDGDHDATAGCIPLPGGLAPERVVFSGLKNLGWPDIPARFGVGAGTLLTVLEDAILEPDHHKWNTIVGDRIVKSSTSVWELLCNQWCKSCLTQEERQAIYGPIKDVIDAGQV
jgi:predicted ATPase